MWTRKLTTFGALLALALPALGDGLPARDDDPDYFHEGDLAGSLRADSPLPIYDPDPGHPWNRLFAALAIRRSHLPSRRGGPLTGRIEGGDRLDFLGWPGTTYWSEPATVTRLDALLDEFLGQRGDLLIRDPLRRVVFQRDLWAAFDFLVGQDIERRGAPADRRRRDALARKLAAAIEAVALPRESIAALPDNYAAAIASGRFAREHRLDPTRDYLPEGLLTRPEEWAEIDFFRPDIHEDIEGRFVTLHTRAYRGRSYFRIFYRFPGGRAQLEEYLKYVDAEGVDWKSAAHDGFIRLRPGLRQIPVGTEVALVQFLMALDDRLRPTPTRLVESVRLRVFKGVDGAEDPTTNTGVGMNVSEYTFRRRLLFDGLRRGGLEREPDDEPQYRVIFQPRDAPDWGPGGRTQTLARQCRSCHTGGGDGGVYTLASLTNQGGFDAGAQLGIAHPLRPGEESPRGGRAARWKVRDETYRRLLEYRESAAAR